MGETYSEKSPLPRLKRLPFQAFHLLLFNPAYLQMLTLYDRDLQLAHPQFFLSQDDCGIPGEGNGAALSPVLPSWEAS